MPEMYRWEAERKDGAIITVGDDLSQCVRFSLIPITDGLVPRHDFIGTKLLRRFIRHFQKVKFNDLNVIQGGLRWENGSEVVGCFEDLRNVIKAGYTIRQQGPEEMCPWCTVMSVHEKFIIIDSPYTGKSAKKCNSRYHIPAPSDIHLHCVVGKGWRAWVNAESGSLLMTPEGQEVYL